LSAGKERQIGHGSENADITDYRYATGFESLLGFLYLKKDYDRLMDILRMAVSQN